MRTMSLSLDAARARARQLRERLSLRDDRGVAAIEFALIAPVMIGLYLSTVVTTQAYMASRKVALVARALADVASRQAVGATANCTPTNPANPCVGNADVTNFFDAAAAIMAPYTTTPIKMTLSRIDVMQDSSSNLWAYTKWSVSYNGVLRPCDGTATSNPTTGATAPPPPNTMTTSSSNRPLLAPLNPVSTTASGYQNNLAKQYTTSVGANGFLLVADIVYTYTPGFTFKVFNWSNLTSITTGWTQAFWSRTGLPVDGHSLSATAVTLPGSSTAVTTTVNTCSQNDGTSTWNNP